MFWLNGKIPTRKSEDLFGLELVDIPVFYLKLVVSIARTLRLHNISQLSYLLVGRAFPMCRTTAFFYRASYEYRIHTI